MREKSRYFSAILHTGLLNILDEINSQHADSNIAREFIRILFLNFYTFLLYNPIFYSAVSSYISMLTKIRKITTSLFRAYVLYQDYRDASKK